MRTTESFEITEEYLDNLRYAIANKNEVIANELIDDLHPADIAEIYEDLDINEAKYLFLLLSNEKAGYVLSELDDNDRDRFLAVLSNEEIATRFLEHMDTDDAADIVADLPKDRKKDILALISDLEQADDIADLLTYDEDTAGGLMAKELITIYNKLTAKECIAEIKRQSEEVDEIYYIYVVDANERLVGTLPLKRLLISNDDTPIDEICDKEIISVTTDVESEEVASIMEKYNLVALPVVDADGRLTGRITIDDVVDVIREDAESDYQKASGLTNDALPSDSVWRLTGARLPWLLIGMAGGIMGARVIGLFEEELQQFASLAFFIPIVGAMGGNAGVQSSAIVVQALASNSLGKIGILASLAKEFMVGSLNAVVISGVLFTYNLFFSPNFALTLTVSSALLIVILVASIMGTLIPMVLDKLDIDPALATGPFITTTNDILGLFVYFTLGHMFFTHF
jgi:magnesium transporter